MRNRHSWSGAQSICKVCYGQGFGWQPWGNLVSLAGDTYGYTAGHPHAVELVNGVDRYDYDANGSMVVRSKGVSGQEQALQWDANNRLAQVVSSSGVTETYRYDEHGQRIRKQVAYSSTVGDTVTYVPFVFYEQAVSAGGSVVTRHYSVNGERVAVRVGGALSYLYHDQVGSTILATDALTNVVSSRGYYAFGATRRSSGVTLTDRRFTGQVEDPTGLYYYNSRYYDPQLGQFLSPDTIVPEPNNLLSYNRYLYGHGNPVKFNDPSGHCVEGEREDFDCFTWAQTLANVYPDKYTYAQASQLSTLEIKDAYQALASETGQPRPPFDLPTPGEVIDTVWPDSGAMSIGANASAGIGVDFVANGSLLALDHEGTIQLIAGGVGIGGNTGPNTDAGFVLSVYPTASNVDVLAGNSVNSGFTFGEGIGGGGEINVTNDPVTRQPVAGLTISLGVSAKANIPVPPVELYTNVSHTVQTPFRINIFDVLGLPRPN